MRLLLSRCHSSLIVLFMIRPRSAAAAWAVQGPYPNSESATAGGAWLSGHEQQTEKLHRKFTARRHAQTSGHWCAEQHRWAEQRNALQEPAWQEPGLAGRHVWWNQHGLAGSSNRHELCSSLTCCLGSQLLNLLLHPSLLLADFLHQAGAQGFTRQAARACPSD